MRAPLFLIPLALSSAACSDPAEFQRDAGVEAPEDRTASAEAEPSAEATAFEEQTGDGGPGERSFAYDWPAEVGAEDALVRRLTAERDRLLAEQKRDYADALPDAPEDCVACRTRSLDKQWQVVADLPDWLSLSAEIATYSGGAHGLYTRQSLVWDRNAKRALAGIDLFASSVDLEQALGARLCDALDAERALRRGSPVARDSGEMFDDCPGLDEASVFVGSSNGEGFDRIGVYFGPYVAGPYAEGPYELDFPVTPSVIDAVKPEYANAFKVKR